MIEQSINSNFKPGTLIDGRYQLIELVGEGAMGAVLLCEDITLRNSPIILKFLKEECLQNKKHFERFQNEALLMRELNHPNIVHVYDLCKLNKDDYFISMEYISGTSLRGLLDDSIAGSLSLEDTIRILKEIAKGMGYAHSKEIIHRDLKPDNVLISREGEVKVTDFGLGKALVIEEDITELGEAVGTPHYMAPEQLKGLKLDARCDIYSFGVMAYELITGEKPFQETNYLKLARKHIEEPFPKICPQKYNIPKWFNNFLAKCTAKNKKNRLQSFEEVEKVLNSFNEKKNRANSELVQDLSGRLYWNVKWTFEKWHIKKIFLSISLIAVSIAFIVLLGKNNPKIRSIYAPSVITIEKSLGLDLNSFKTFAFGKSLAEHAHFDEDELLTAAKKGRVETVKMLLKAGVSPGTKNKDGENTLMIAAENASIPLVELILGHLDTKEINTQDKFGFTPLIHAIKGQNIRIIQILLASGADVHQMDKALCTPMMHAVTLGNERIVKILLKNGAATSLRHKNKKGKSALKIARAKRNNSIIKIIKQNIN